MGKEKKEIGKLLELLNEYAKKLGIGDYVGWHNKKTVENSDYIFTKKFGFIKWLVENDKIDFELDSIIHKHKGIDFNTGKGIVVEKLCNRYESLLMLLSISDTPIEDLISYLK